MHTLQYEFKLDYLSIRIPLPGIEKHVYIVCWYINKKLDFHPSWFTFRLGRLTHKETYKSIGVEYIPESKTDINF